ncbi:MAG: PAS domain S-box protein, partial [Bacteroidota bacterium]
MNFQFDFSLTNGKSSHLYCPISLPSLLKRRTTKLNRQIILLWGLSMLVSIVVGLISLQYNWSGIPIYIGGTLAYITLYPPLIICTFLTLWFGVWWGFVPAVLSTLALAVFSGMAFTWAVVFAFTNSLGLAVITLFFRSIPISIELRSPFAILFYIFVAFIASLVSSIGSIIWTYSNGLTISAIFAVWQGWWFGNFLQTVFINGPIFMLAGKLIVRWKSRSEDMRQWKVPSPKIIAMVFTVILVILIAFFWGTHFLSEIKLHNIVATTNDGVLLAAITSTFEDMALMHWVNLSLVVFTAFFGYQVAINWTDTLRKSVTTQTKALRDSERHYRILFENNPLPFWVYDLETLEFLAVNDAAIHHYGYSRNEFLTMNVKDIRPTEDVPDLLRNTIHQRSGIENAGIWRHRKKDGTIIDVEVRSHELTFQGRRAKLVLVNDITERKKSEQALKESEAKFRAVAETAASAIFIYQGTKFSYINPSFAAITGYSFEEIRTVNFWDIVHSDYREIVRERGIARQRGDNVPSRY